MLCEYFIWFIIYSFIGWIYESAFCTIRARRWRNRGFLYGPVIPIYGIGALGVSLLPVCFPEIALSGWKVFLVCMAGSAALEYFTSWVLEKLFHARWWDYSGVPLNLNGRVCFPVAVGFGLAGLLILHVIYPLMDYMTGLIPTALLQAAAFAFFLGIVMDLLMTVCILSGLSPCFVHILYGIKDQDVQWCGGLKTYRKLDAMRLWFSDGGEFARRLPYAMKARFMARQRIPPAARAKKHVGIFHMHSIKRILIGQQ